MKRIKSFKVFESKSIDVDKVCSLYEDIKALDYILEEEGIIVNHVLKVVCIPDGTLQKEIRLIKISSTNSIRDILDRPKTQLRSLCLRMVLGPNNMKRVDGINYLKSEVDRYLVMLAEHLDYIQSDYIKSSFWYSRPDYYEIEFPIELFN